MPTSNKKSYWVIQVMDGLEIVSEQKVLLGQLTNNGVCDLLRTLVAKYSLSDEEIVGCYAKKGTKIHLDLLETRATRGPKKRGFTCGTNPHAIAYVQHAQ